MKIRRAQRTDLPGIVEAHQKAFPDFLMSLLGWSFLHAYYSTVLDYPRHIALIALDEKKSI